MFCISSPIEDFSAPRGTNSEPFTDLDAGATFRSPEMDTVEVLIFPGVGDEECDFIYAAWACHSDVDHVWNYGIAADSQTI